MSRRSLGLAGLGLAFAILSSVSSVSSVGHASSAPEAPVSVVVERGPIVQSGGPRVTLSDVSLSRPLRELPDATAVATRHFRAPGRNPFAFGAPGGPDPVVQSLLPAASMPAATLDVLGQGTTLGGCVFPSPDAGEPSGCTTIGIPPDTNGAVGPNHYLQIVNGGVAVWSKTGMLVTTPKYTNGLFSGISTADGNHCSTENDGDGVVLYDSMADRWLVTQFDLYNYIKSNTGPAYQCVAVSQTADPTGAYYLYDFQYAAAINDYGKFGVWQDGYYATFNDFAASGGSSGADLCAYDRASMLQGKPATQQCFLESQEFGVLPANVDGPIKPPDGEPEFFVTLNDATSLHFYAMHVDWTTPGNSAITGPTTLTVASYGALCGGGSCVVQPSPGNKLASLGDRPMFHLGYRNYGTVESLTFNHSVTAGSAGGVRWYEIQSPAGTPVVAQQGTYAPGDGNFRWMGSIAQDQAEDMALGFSESGSSMAPSIAWTGRLASDPSGQMGQGEAVIDDGAGVETGTFPPPQPQPADRWGDYSNMTVDPSDDCTFWYTTELYPGNGIFNWDTRIAAFKFPACAANDFAITIAPSMQNLPPAAAVQYTVTTTSTKGTAEAIALTVQDLPSGVTGTLSQTSVTAGGTSTLTLTSTASTPFVANAPIMVIGKAPSAVHAATAQVTVGICKPLTTCPAPENCGMISDGCGGMVACGACTAPQTCAGGGTANVCGCMPMACPAADNCGTIPDGCGGMATCGSCAPHFTCVTEGAVNRCEATTPGDASAPDSGATDSSVGTGADAQPPAEGGGGSTPDASADASEQGDGGGGGASPGSSGGCGCRTVDAPGPCDWPLAGLAGVALLGMTRRRRGRR